MTTVPNIGSSSKTSFLPSVTGGGGGGGRRGRWEERC